MHEILLEIRKPMHHIFNKYYCLVKDFYWFCSSFRFWLFVLINQQSSSNRFVYVFRFSSFIFRLIINKLFTYIPNAANDSTNWHSIQLNYLNNFKMKMIKMNLIFIFWHRLIVWILTQFGKSMIPSGISKCLISRIESKFKND